MDAFLFDQRLKIRYYSTCQRPKGRFKFERNMGIINYIRETKGEMKHVSWPTRRQTTAFTLIIIVVSIFVAAYLGLFDWIFTNILELFV